MQSTSSRFETTLPKEHFYSPPPKPAIKPETAADRRNLRTLGIIAVTFIATVQLITLLRQPAAVVTPPTPAATPPTAQVMPYIQVTPEVRRAQLVAPPIGSTSSTIMPDGHSTVVRYMGTLGSFDQLPRNPQWGDMWRIPRSGASWVWYTPAGFTRPAWVDP